MTKNFDYADSLMKQLKTLAPIDNHTTKYLGKLLLEYRFRPHTNAIETINQSNEIPALEEDLRKAILNYYALCENAKERELISNTQIQTKYEPYINEHYPEVFQKNSEWAFVIEFYKDNPRNIIELDRNSFRSDKQLEALGTSRYFQSEFLKNFYTSLLKFSEEILGKVEKLN
jgi:hypothetical protein